MKAIQAMERIEIKKAYPEHVKQHARVNDAYVYSTCPELKGMRLIDVDIATAAKLNVRFSVMSGKLDGLFAISTTCTINPRCLQGMQDPNSPCYYCFAAATASQYNSLREWLENNYRILSGRDLTDNEIHALCVELAKNKRSRFVRIEFAGDVGNVTQVRNYIRIVKAGREYGLYFGIWTKQLDLWDAGIKLEGKPINCTLIYSAPQTNQTEFPIVNAYNWVDCIFVVANKKEFDKVWNTIAAAGYPMHKCMCENGSCNNTNICAFCYRPIARRENNNGMISVIVEMLRK